MSLTHLAFEVLEDSSAPPGLKSVACATLLHAFDAGVDTPPGAHMAVWRFLLSSDASSSLLHRHEIPSREVARDAVRVLLDINAGENAHDLALAALKGPIVGEIAEVELFTIVDRATDDRHVRRAAWLVERCHEERGFSPEFLTALRNRLAGSSVSAVRAGALEIGSLLARLDEHFVIRMFQDSTPVVRAAVADSLEKVDEIDRPTAAALARAQLAIETHRTVVSTLHYALGSLVKTSGRRIRSLEPPSGEGEH